MIPKTRGVPTATIKLVIPSFDAPGDAPAAAALAPAVRKGTFLT
jgi:hypothetical protein